MNTMLADSLNWIAEKLEAALNGGADKNAAVIAVLKELMELHGNAVFGGDGYSAEWHKAAVEERGLKNIPTTADALPAFQSDDVIALFESTGVLSPVELASRYEVYSEQYVLAIEVEAKLVIEMAKTTIYPAAIAYLSSLASTADDLKDLGIKLDKSTAESVAKETHSMMDAVAKESNAMMAGVAKLSEALEKEDFASTEEHMQFLANDVCSLMLEVRTHADALEGEVSDDMWPLAKYREMLFIK
jgi:glutamine synthetase